MDGRPCRVYYLWDKRSFFCRNFSRVDQDHLGREDTRRSPASSMLFTCESNQERSITFLESILPHVPRSKHSPICHHADVISARERIVSKHETTPGVKARDTAT